MSQASSRKVNLDQLKVGMTIEEITELSFDYASLDEERVAFLKRNFKGATAVLVGEDGLRSAPVEELQTFDPLQSIVRIPPTLPFAQVKEGSAALLESHGMLEFKVVHSPEGAAAQTASKSAKNELEVGSQAARKRHEKKLEEIRAFMDTVAPAEQNRSKASEIVREMLNAGRAGKFGSAGVEAVVEDILRQGSSPAMKAIAGLRSSDQTYAHCTDMSVILQECYVATLERMGKRTSEANKRFALIAGFMHDIGKSEVPMDILESTQRFAPDSREMILMRNHTTYGARILTQMGMPEPTVNVAAYHHVKKDATLLNSYPVIDYDQVLPLTRMAAITDVYQALIGRRRYKKNWVPGKAVEYLLSLEGSEFDERMVNFFIRSVGRYPVGSLLRLSTGDIGFVLSIGPDEFPERPIVAVVENVDGMLLGQQTMVDLMLDADAQVVEVLDHYDHYSESEHQAYDIFQGIRVS